MVLFIYQVKEGVPCGPTNWIKTNRSLTIYPWTSNPKDAADCPWNREAVQLSSTSTVHGHLARLEKRVYPKRSDETSCNRVDKTRFRKDWDSSNNYSSTWRRNSWRTHFSSRGCFRLLSNPSNLSSEEGSLFMLTIRGDSMINAGILDGDNVIVRKQETAQNGDIVIAMTAEDEATCKRFYKEKNFSVCSLKTTCSNQSS